MSTELQKFMYLRNFYHHIMVAVVALLGLEGQIEVHWRDDCLPFLFIYLLCSLLGERQKFRPIIFVGKNISFII